MPVGDVLVGDAGGHVEHDDAALAVDVVAITEAAELLLAGRVPHVELDVAVILQALVNTVPMKVCRIPKRAVGGGDLRC